MGKNATKFLINCGSFLNAVSSSIIPVAQSTVAAYYAVFLLLKLLAQLFRLSKGDVSERRPAVLGQLAIITRAAEKA